MQSSHPSQTTPIFHHYSRPIPNPILHLQACAFLHTQAHHDFAFVLYRHKLRKGKPTPNNFIYPHVLKLAPEILESSGTKMPTTTMRQSVSKMRLERRRRWARRVVVTPVTDIATVAIAATVVAAVVIALRLH
ncbi:hypothetical protein V6N13_051206 [Hibiscus sabdariffa]|uniref:Transmembrane protein n=1 Tax=Hibiscus sabdariffa TaxID=183260 RepID=A0ABR2T339_9ROSI